MMEKQRVYIIKVFKSNYCKFLFLLFFVLSYFLIPASVFYGIYTLLAIAFMISFSLTLTCLIRNIKERVLVAKEYKKSIVGILASAVGLTALQVCGVGAPLCGAYLGAGILSTILPGFFMNFLEKYSVVLILFSIVFQIIGLKSMNCFKKIVCKK